MLSTFTSEKQVFAILKNIDWDKISFHGTMGLNEDTKTPLAIRKALLEVLGDLPRSVSGKVQDELKFIKDILGSVIAVGSWKEDGLAAAFAVGYLVNLGAKNVLTGFIENFQKIIGAIETQPKSSFKKSELKKLFKIVKVGKLLLSYSLDQVYLEKRLLVDKMKKAGLYKNEDGMPEEQKKQLKKWEEAKDKEEEKKDESKAFKDVRMGTGKVSFVYIEQENKKKVADDIVELVKRVNNLREKLNLKYPRELAEKNRLAQENEQKKQEEKIRETKLMQQEQEKKKKIEEEKMKQLPKQEEKNKEINMKKGESEKYFSIKLSQNKNDKNKLTVAFLDSQNYEILGFHNYNDIMQGEVKLNRYEEDLAVKLKSIDDDFNKLSEETKKNEKSLSLSKPLEKVEISEPIRSNNQLLVDIESSRNFFIKVINFYEEAGKAFVKHSGTIKDADTEREEITFHYMNLKEAIVKQQKATDTKIWSDDKEKQNKESRQKEIINLKKTNEEQKTKLKEVLDFVTQKAEESIKIDKNLEKARLPDNFESKKAYVVSFVINSAYTYTALEQIVKECNGLKQEVENKVGELRGIFDTNQLEEDEVDWEETIYTKNESGKEGKISDDELFSHKLKERKEKLCNMIKAKQSDLDSQFNSLTEEYKNNEKTLSDLEIKLDQSRKEKQALDSVEKRVANQLEKLKEHKKQVKYAYEKANKSFEEQNTRKNKKEKELESLSKGNIEKIFEEKHNVEVQKNQLEEENKLLKQLRTIKSKLDLELEKIKKEPLKYAQSILYLDCLDKLIFRAYAKGDKILFTQENKKEKVENIKSNDWLGKIIQLLERIRLFICNLPLIKGATRLLFGPGKDDLEKEVKTKKSYSSTKEMLRDFKRVLKKAVSDDQLLPSEKEHWYYRLPLNACVYLRKKWLHLEPTKALELVKDLKNGEEEEGAPEPKI